MTSILTIFVIVGAASSTAGGGGGGGVGGRGNQDSGIGFNDASGYGNNRGAQQSRHDRRTVQYN